MVGFALAHAYVEWLLVGSAGALVAHVWVILFAILAVYRLSSNGSLPTRDWAQCAALVVVLTTFYIPYGCWQYATVAVAGAGHDGAGQLWGAAAEDQQYLAKALLDAGVPVNAPGLDGETALNAACRNGHRRIAHYLHARGGDLDNAPKCREFPEFASKMKPNAATDAPRGGRPQVPSVTVEVH
jgi:hypothetical protein